MTATLTIWTLGMVWTGAFMCSALAALAWLERREVEDW